MLGANPGAQCYLLRFKGTTILLDCGVEVNRLAHFFPLIASAISPEAPAAPAAGIPLCHCVARMFALSL